MASPTLSSPTFEAAKPHGIAERLRIMEQLREELFSRRNSLTKDELRKDATQIAKLFEEAAIMAEVVLTDRTFSSIDFESIRDVRKRVDEALYRLVNFESELKLDNIIRSLHCQALKVARKSQRLSVN